MGYSCSFPPLWQLLLNPYCSPPASTRRPTLPPPSSQVIPSPTHSAHQVWAPPIPPCPLQNIYLYPILFHFFSHRMKWLILPPTFVTNFQHYLNDIVLSFISIYFPWPQLPNMLYTTYHTKHFSLQPPHLWSWLHLPPNFFASLTLYLTVICLRPPQSDWHIALVKISDHLLWPPGIPNLPEISAIHGISGHPSPTLLPL